MPSPDAYLMNFQSSNRARQSSIKILPYTVRCNLEIDPGCPTSPNDQPLTSQSSGSGRRLLQQHQSPRCQRSTEDADSPAAVAMTNRDLAVNVAKAGYDKMIPTAYRHHLTAPPPDVHSHTTFTTSGPHQTTTAAFILGAFIFGTKRVVFRRRVRSVCSPRHLPSGGR